MMVKSSVLIQVILFILKTLERWYKHSACHRVFAWIGNGIARAMRGSALYRLSARFEEDVERSRTFACLRWLFRLINTLAEWIRLRIGGAVDGSRLFTATGRFRSLSAGLYTASMASAGFGLSLSILAILTKNIAWGVGWFFFAAGLFGIYYSVNIEEKLQSSVSVRAAKWIIGLLDYDEEAEPWKDK